MGQGAGSRYSFSRHTRRWGGVQGVARLLAPFPVVMLSAAKHPCAKRIGRRPTLEKAASGAACGGECFARGPFASHGDPSLRSGRRSQRETTQSAFLATGGGSAPLTQRGRVRRKCDTCTTQRGFAPGPDTRYDEETTPLMRTLWL